jgi:hypothetical protein
MIEQEVPGEYGRQEQKNKSIGREDHFLPLNVYAYSHGLLCQNSFVCFSRAVDSRRQIFLPKPSETGISSGLILANGQTILVNNHSEIAVIRGGFA